MWFLIALACSTPAPDAHAPEGHAPEARAHEGHPPEAHPHGDKAPHNKGVKAAEDYAHAVDVLIEHVEDKSFSLEQIGADALALSQSSVSILEAFSEKEPTCKEYLTATIAMLDKLEELDAEQLEDGYHKDGALPEASGICYHAKDLLVHPASVVALARLEDSHEVREEMEHELKEVVAHVRAVRQQIAH